MVPSISAIRTEFTIRELAELILELTGSRSKIVHRPLPQDDPQKRRPDISEAERVLGWRPAISLREGLTKTIPYFEQLVAQGNVVGAHLAARTEQGTLI